MQSNPAIVITAYNRPASLARLLRSLVNAVYPGAVVELIISIDKSGLEDVVVLARSFEWKHGIKTILIQEEHLGLKKHILKCGGLAETYGAIIMLEDDLAVSPYFYSYAKQAMAFYNNNDNIAGISLYNYQVAEGCFYPFTAIDDGADVYFMQVASSWGQLWTAGQWQAFKSWYAHHPELPTGEKIPSYIQAWGEHSWKKHFIHYLIDTNRYFVFPRLSLSTNFEDAGTNSTTRHTFQVPLQATAKGYHFSTTTNSRARYDAWFELLPDCLTAFCPVLSGYAYAVDLYGTKPLSFLNCDYVLTSQQGNEPLLSFSNELDPFELNIVLQLPGNAIGLYKNTTNSFKPAKINRRNVLEEQKEEDQSGISIIIPVEEFDTEHIRTTLASVAFQKFKNIECILVASKETREQEKITNGFDFRIRLVNSKTPLSLEGLVALGFKHANKGILTWIAPGNAYNELAFKNVISVFRSNLSVSWLCGVTESMNNYSGLNVRPYRLVASEAYRLLQNENLNASTELHFFRKHCVDGVSEQLSTADILFNLLQSYQLIVIVVNLGTIKFNTVPVISQGKKQVLLKKYSFLKQEHRSAVFLIDRFLAAFFPSKKISRWFYPVLNKFPNVLRYDEKHDTFYYDWH